MEQSKKRSYAKRSLGQNFLVDGEYIRKVIEAIDLSHVETVIEIGPGRGALTEHLVASGAEVLAVELDREFVPMLRDRFAKFPNFRAIEADATAVDFATLRITNPQSAIRNPHLAKVIANLPYYISTAILQKLSDHRTCFSSLVLMFQREVVDRITAKPGNSDRGYLTVLVESAFVTEKLFDVPPTAFRPQPKVWSSVVRMIPKETVIKNPNEFRKMVSTGFAHKRKTILNNLKTIYPDVVTALERASIDPDRRAETFSLEEWLRLAKVISDPK